MCGLAGEIRFDGRTADVAACERMNDCQEARGPDGSGIWARGPVALGHRRLSIIDLSVAGSQPMVDSPLGLSVVFNGCIYNYQQLRAELEGAGFRFFSTSDTEVIGKAYAHWGLSCVEHFLGMFAFAIYEHVSGRLVLGRDRLGIKPLYLDHTRDRLRFASSLPALLAAGGVDTSVDMTALSYYMTFHSVVPAPRTILSGVTKLPPATVRVIEADGTIGSDWLYWEPDFARDPDKADWTDKDWEEALLSSLRTAVDRRMVADVPVGVLLSGGIDSSLVVALLAEAGQHDLKTFSIGFESAGGESGRRVRVLHAGGRAVRDRPPPDPHPLGSPAARHRRGHRRDERADGQPRLRGVLPAQPGGVPARQGRAVRAGRRRGAGRVRLVSPVGLGAPDGCRGGVLVGVLRPALGRAGRGLNPEWMASVDEPTAFITDRFGRVGAETSVDAALRNDTTIMLVDDPVKRVDNMTMAAGLEARVPFLDHELVELAGKIPPGLKLSDGGKGVLKRAARGVVPDEVIDRTKGYFPVPAIRQLEGPYLERVRSALTDSAAQDRGLFNPALVDRLLADPNTTRTTLGSNALWQLALLEMWLQHHGI